MAKSVTELARKLLKQKKEGLEDLRVHMFELDGDEEDDDLHEQLHAEFSAEFERVQSELAAELGAPVRTGDDDDDAIPLNGVFRFAIWQANGKSLFVAAAHEDRDCPVILILGTTADR
ncbi:MAG: hypothetical protein IT365_20595 [Candidatus Hydrogenedentes bacterium]|nr:hypothetical protein [Candidatus Hydrogenedentota bacterium]